MLLVIRAIPNASKSEIVGWMADGSLKIKIAAPPVDGKANTELVSFLAKTLTIKKSDIEITNGLTSKKKTLRVPVYATDLVKVLTEKFGIPAPTQQSKLF